MLASIGPLTSGCILCAHSCCNYPLSCRGVGGEALSSVSPLQRYGTKMAESDLWWLIVTYGDLEWNKTKNMLCPSDYLRRPPTRLWEMLYIRRVNLSNLCHLWSALCHLYSKKNFTSPCVRCRAENPRIVKARSSHGISREHERTGAWQYVSISRAMWERKRERKI